MTDLNSVAHRIVRYLDLIRLFTVQYCFDAVQDTAYPQHKSVKLTAPVGAESHICDKLIFHELIVQKNMGKMFSSGDM